MDAIEFLRQVNGLKTVKRTGWIVEGIKEPESVAEHSFGTALLVLVFGQKRKDINPDKAMKMALIHDLAESETGDILVDWKVNNFFRPLLNSIPGRHHGITGEEKHEIERKVMENLTEKIENGEELFNLWMEFEEGETKEAVFVRSLDKLEMLFQCIVYEKSQGTDLSHWILDKRNEIEDLQVREIFKEILERRKK